MKRIKRILIMVLTLVFFAVGTYYTFIGLSLLPSILRALPLVLAGLWGVIGSFGLFRREKWGWWAMVALFLTAICVGILQLLTDHRLLGRSIQVSWDLLIGQAVFLSLLMWLRSEIANGASGGDKSESTLKI